MVAEERRRVVGTGAANVFGRYVSADLADELVNRKNMKVEKQFMALFSNTNVYHG